MRANMGCKVPQSGSTHRVHTHNTHGCPFSVWMRWPAAWAVFLYQGPTAVHLTLQLQQCILPMTGQWGNPSTPQLLRSHGQVPCATHNVLHLAPRGRLEAEMVLRLRGPEQAQDLLEPTGSLQRSGTEQPFKCFSQPDWQKTGHSAPGA